MSKLKENLWAAAREYARLFGEIIEAEPEHWVGDEPGLCCFGDCYFFTLEEIRTVVDNLPKYVKRYGSKEAVGQEVRDWVDWWLDSVPECEDMSHVMERVTYQLRPNLNLQAWLDGAPRDDRHPWNGPEADYIRLLNDRDTLQRLIAEYRGNRSLDNVLTAVLTKLEIERKAKEKRDAEERKNIINRQKLL